MIKLSIALFISFNAFAGPSPNINSLVPAMAGQSGKCLTNNGTTVNAWGACAAGGAGVTTVNSLNGAVTVAAGTAMTVTSAASTVTITNNGVTAVNSIKGATTIAAGTAIGVTSSGSTVTIANNGVATVNSISGATILAGASGVSVSSASQTVTVALSAIASNNLLFNVSTGSLAPVATSLSTAIDDAIGSTQGELLYRGSSTWGVLAPGTSGQVLQTGGGSANPQWAAGVTPNIKLANATEPVDVIAAAPASTTALYVANGAVQYYTSNAANNFTLNIAWTSSTSLATAMSTGDAITSVLLVTQSSTAYFTSTVQIDGTATGVTTNWQGGTAPTAGNVNGIDAYSCTTIKTAATPTYQVLCSLTQF